MINTTLIIARHGNTFNPDDVVTRVGKTDLPLVASGLAQGKRIGKYLKANKLLPDVIFTSALQRTIQTAEEAQIAAGITLPTIPLLSFNEIDYGMDENQPETQVIARIGKEALHKWEQEAIAPAGWQVNPEEIIANWQHFANDILLSYQGKKILVVTSNGIARFAPYLTGDFAAFTRQHAIKMKTGSLSILQHAADADYWQCLGWNIIPSN